MSTKKNVQMVYWLNQKTGVRLQAQPGSAVDRKCEDDAATFRKVRSLVDGRTSKSEDDAA